MEWPADWPPASIFVAMLLAALSLWTAIPLGWLWIGSKVADTQFPSMGPYAVVAFGILISVLVVAWMIGRLNRLYMESPAPRLAPMRPGWMKSMRDTCPGPAPPRWSRPS